MTSVTAPPTFSLEGDYVHVEHECIGHLHEPLLLRMSVVRKLGQPVPIGRWKLINPDPLTIMPAINCLLCGLRGFIVGGEWWNLDA